MTTYLETILSFLNTIEKKSATADESKRSKDLLNDKIIDIQTAVLHTVNIL